MGIIWPKLQQFWGNGNRKKKFSKFKRQKPKNRGRDKPFIKKH